MAAATDGNTAMMRLLRRAGPMAQVAVPSLSGGGRPLPAEHRARFEAAFGHDFSHVRVHDDSAAARAAAELSAHAFALGADLYFGSGELAPGTRDGDRLLAHELTHVVQHDEGRLPSGGGVSSPTDAVELEAYANEARIVAALPAAGPSLAAAASTLGADAFTAPAPTEAVVAPAPAGPSATVARAEGEAPSEGEAGAVDPERLRELMANAELEAVPLDEGALAELFVDEAEAEEEAEEEAPDAEVEAPEADAAPEGSADTPLPPPPITPTAPPPSAPPQEPVPLDGASPAEVASSYGEITPTERALSHEQLGAGLQGGTDAAQSALAEQVPDLHATLTDGDEALEPGAPIVIDPAVEASTASDPTLQAAPEAEVAEADVGEAAITDASAVTSAFDGVADGDPEAIAAALGEALGSVPTSDGAIDTTLEVPEVPLTGAADPALADAATAEAAAEQAAALASAQQAVVDGPGPETVQLASLDEPFEVAAPEAPDVSAVDEQPDLTTYAEWELPGDVQAAFDVEQQQVMSDHLAPAEADLDAAEAEYDAEGAAAIEAAQLDVTAANADFQAQQVAEVQAARADITAEQQATIGAQQAAVADATAQMDTERAASLAQIDARVVADRASIAAEYASAQSQADQLVADGERDAAQLEADAQAEAEDQSWWDKAVSAVSDALDALVDAVLDLWASIRDAVSELLDAAVAFATELIDAALAFVTELLQAYYDFVRFLVQELLADVFPELAELLLAAIDAIEAAVLSALSAIADALKAAVQAIADALLAALDAWIALVEAALTVYKTLIMAVLTGDWALLAEMALRAVLLVAGIPYDDFMATMGKVVEIWDEVLENPGNLASNAAKALGLGFEQFGANFLDHFIAGAVEWITGATGIVMPESFDVAGIFDITCQVLGLTYDHLREKAVEHLGEGAVGAIEEVYEAVLAFMDGGWAGLWEHVQGELTSLVDDVVIAIGTWLVEKAILVAGRWIAGLAATMGLSAIVEALIAAWQFTMWVIDQMNAMWGVVEATVDSVHDFVMGDIGPAANRIESTLADLIPIAIDLVAKLLNIGNIADKVQEIIEATREMIDHAIDSVFETVLGALGLGGEDEDDGSYDGELGERISFTAGGEGHSLWIEGETPMVASTVMPVTQRIADWRSRLSDEPSATDGQGGPTDQALASSCLTEADGLLTALLTEVDEADDVIEAEGGTEAAEGTDEKARADDEVEAAQRPLADVIAQLFGLYQDEAPDASFGDPVSFTGVDGKAHTLAVGDGGSATIDGASVATVAASAREAAGEDAEATSDVSAFESAAENLEATAAGMLVGEDGGDFEATKADVASKAAKVVGRAAEDNATKFANDLAGMPTGSRGYATDKLETQPTYSTWDEAKSWLREQQGFKAFLDQTSRVGTEDAYPPTHEGAEAALQRAADDDALEVTVADVDAAATELVATARTKIHGQSAPYTSLYDALTTWLLNEGGSRDGSLAAADLAFDYAANKDTQAVLAPPPASAEEDVDEFDALVVPMASRGEILGNPAGLRNTFLGALKAKRFANAAGFLSQIREILVYARNRRDAKWPRLTGVELRIEGTQRHADFTVENEPADGATGGTNYIYEVKNYNGWDTWTPQMQEEKRDELYRQVVTYLNSDRASAPKNASTQGSVPVDGVVIKFQGLVPGDLAVTLSDLQAEAASLGKHFSWTNA